MAALAPFITDRVGASPLLIARSGRHSSERTVHGQLRRIGELAGLGDRPWLILLVDTYGGRTQVLAGYADAADRQVVGSARA